MASAQFTVKSQTEVEMTIKEDEKPSPSIRLGASDIENLIVNLSKFRRAMLPEVSRTLPDGQLPPSPIDPLWRIEASPLMEGKMLFVRDEGLGWLMFQFPPDEAAKLGNALLAQQKAGPSGPPSGTGRPH